MRVKICGITSYDDAMLSIDAGADALGFVFYPESKRYLSPAKAAYIISKLPPFIEKVGLFVNESAEEIIDKSRLSGITLAQLHFDVNDSFLETVNFPVIPVVRARQQDDLMKFKNRYRLVDAYCESYGGSGKRLNLEWFKDIDCSKIILAGGLTPENIHELSGFGFYGVDVSSGTEAGYGKKDPKKIKDFIYHAKSI